MANKSTIFSSFSSASAASRNKSTSSSSDAGANISPISSHISSSTTDFSNTSSDSSDTASSSSDASKRTSSSSDVSEKNSIDIRELITVNFYDENHHGIYRFIPEWLKYTNKDGVVQSREARISKLTAVDDYYQVGSLNNKAYILR